MSRGKIKTIPVMGTPEWMISFGDLMSCLLVFFVLLLTFSSSKPARLMDMMGEYVGPGGEEASADVGDTTGAAGALKRIEVAPEDEAAMRLSDLIVAQRYQDFKESLWKLGFKQQISYALTEDGFYVEVERSALLGSDGAPNPDGSLLLQSLANAASSIKKEFRILGIPAKAKGVEPSLRKGSESFSTASALLSALQGKYKIPGLKSSCGVLYDGKAKDRVRFLIADKMEGEELGMDEISKMKD